MNAANVVGAMLTRWHYIGLALPLLLLAIEWRRARSWVIAMVFAGVVFAALQAAVDLRIRKIRDESPVAISALSKDDPIRRRFGLMHGVSSLLLVAQLLAAAGATVFIETPKPNESETQTS